MSIGEALAEARDRVGLTVKEVSERTRIRASIIRDIERNDFASCAGDFYARGHIRAIARVVATDPVPLIEQYDQAHNWSSGMEILNPDAYADGSTRQLDDDTDPPDDSEPPPGSGPPASGPPSGPPAPNEPLGRSSARASPSPGPPEQPSAAAPQPGSNPGAKSEHSLMTEALRPPRPVQIREHRPVNVTALLTLGLLAAIGVIAYLFAANSNGSNKAPAAAPRPTTQAHPKPAHSASPSATPSTATPVVALAPTSATAFGPGGPGQGDNPQQAGQALSGDAAQAWHTSWYTTAEFGGLQDGTGLLLDMGKQVTITSAEVTLGTTPGADLQLRAGNVPTLSGLSPVARASDAGGAVLMHFARPVRGRYLLIWFTRLPPDNAGTFEAWISNVQLKGTS